MKIPKKIEKDNREYIFEKIYPNFIMYKDSKLGTKTCFKRQEIGLIKEIKVSQEGRLKGINGIRVQEVQIKIYGIYDIRQKEQYERVGTLKEITKFLNLTTREIQYGLKKHLIRNKYEMCYLFKEQEGTKDMTREDLKNYKYTQEWIKDRTEHIEEYKTSITNITSILSDMPKRK